MIGLVAAVALGLSTLGAGLKPPALNVRAENSIVEKAEDNVAFVQWHNGGRLLSDDKKSSGLFDEYGVNPDEAQKSMDVFIQEECVSFEENVPAGYTDSSSSPLGAGDSKEDEYVHNKGYIKFITKAYALGFYDGGIVYHVEVTTKQQKFFVINHKDNLIIRHGENAVTFVDGRYPTSGTRYTPCKVYMTYDPTPSILDEHEDLSPSYPSSGAGIYYTFSSGGTPASGQGGNVQFGFTTVTGDYYLVATDTTEVQPVYVHNLDLFLDSLSISFGHVGIGISVNGGNDVMEGRPMTLKGYGDTLRHKTHTMAPKDWGFEERYYFQGEGLKKSTVASSGLVIDTERLRCGYIKEQYINLSPNRYDAGDAYLELRFDKPVFEFGSYMSFWSANEYLFSAAGDYAYVQYLDGEGNWTNCIDLLSAGLPTDRMKPKYFEYDFIEGTLGMKFVAHKESPNSDRNRGRICIGETKFVTYALD